MIEEHTEKIDRIMRDPKLEDAWEKENKEKVAITLSPTVKKEATILLRHKGGKLSPLLDSLLVSWIYKQRLINKMIKDMEKSTETLIKMFKHPKTCMKDYHKGRLQGRLDIIEAEMKFFDDSWIQNGQDRIASENFKIVQDRLQWLKNERENINSVLSESGDIGGKNGK